MPQLKKHFNFTTVGIMIRMSNDIVLFDVDVVTYLCPNPDDN